MLPVTQMFRLAIAFGTGDGLPALVFHASLIGSGAELRCNFPVKPPRRISIFTPLGVEPQSCDRLERPGTGTPC
ncbi:hypothetical protein L905_20510 [Agrobacterium sp. TS43]|nr:hypothetical protein L907_07875 [Agrobacterium sp. C13]KVK63105.1 hypothetical protein L905_20510 [Agrobacterium sp. TS43]